MKGIGLFRSIQTKLIMMVLLLILIAVQLIGVYFISTMKTSLINSFSTNLNGNASLLTSLLSSSPNLFSDNKDTNAQTGPLRSSSRPWISLDAEIQVLDGGGKVLATSVSEQAYVGRKNTSLLVGRALQGVRDNEEEIIDEDNARNKVIAKPILVAGRWSARYISSLL